MNAKESIIKIENVTKTFGSFTAIDNVSLDIPEGSFMTLLGPSGCGKTTLMRLIAGFHEPDSGTIQIEGKIVNGMPAYKRNTPLVFQDYALFPHMTVYENIAYGLKLKGVQRREIKERVASMLEMFGLQNLEHRFPKQLSGGQQQRVAFARALVIGQKILLMDEPLSNLDAKMRVEVRSELRELQQRTGITAIFVTHDQDEALSLSDRIAVFDKGRVCQVGTPWDVYFRPQNKFVADFVGVANFIDGVVVGMEQGDLIVKSNELVIRASGNGCAVSPGQQVTLVVRPECIAIRQGIDTEASGDNQWRAIVSKSSFLGRIVRYWMDSGSVQWIVDDADPSLRGMLEGIVKISVDKNKIHVLPGAK